MSNANDNDDVDTAYMRGACQAFLKALPSPKLEDMNLFEVLNEEAVKLGYQISAEGIRGTFIRFVPIEDD